MIPANRDFRLIAADQLTALAVNQGAMIIEIYKRNTAPPMLQASLHCLAAFPEAVLLAELSVEDITDADDIRPRIQRCKAVGQAAKG